MAYMKIVYIYASTDKIVNSSKINYVLFVNDSNSVIIIKNYFDFFWIETH